MAYYPETPAPQEYEITPVYSTLVTEMGSGNEQRKKRWSYPKYNAAIRYDREELDIDDMQILWDFYMARKGAYEGFYFFDHYVNMLHYGQYVGTGDDETVIFNIPGRSTFATPASRSLYITALNGTKDEVISGITWGDGTGEGSCDQVTFDTAPAEGEIITIDFKGYLRFYCRFERDDMSRSTFLGLAFSIGINIKGLSPI